MMTHRETAVRIVLLRKLLIEGLVAELTDDTPKHEDARRVFTRLADSLPLGILWREGLERRVVAPAHRKIEREGILAQNSIEHTHQLTLEDSGVLVCPCGYSRRLL